MEALGAIVMFRIFVFRVIRVFKFEQIRDHTSIDFVLSFLLIREQMYFE